MYNPKKLEVGVRLVVNEDPQLANAIAEQKKAMAKQVTASDNKASKAGGAAAAAAKADAPAAKANADAPAAKAKADAPASSKRPAAKTAGVLPVVT